MVNDGLSKQITSPRIGFVQGKLIQDTKMISKKHTELSRKGSLFKTIATVHLIGGASLRK